MLQQRSPRQPTQRPPLVQTDMVGLVALDLILRLVRARVMDIALVVHVPGVNAQDGSAHPASLRIPAHMIANLECSRHEEPHEPSRPTRKRASGLLSAG